MHDRRVHPDLIATVKTLKTQFKKKHGCTAFYKSQHTDGYLRPLKSEWRRREIYRQGSMLLEDGTKHLLNSRPAHVLRFKC